MIPDTQLAYLRTMAHRDRLITLLAEDGETVAGCATFFVLRSDDDLPQFFPRPQWSTPQDWEDGTCIYLDYLECWAWHRDWLRALETQIVGRFPSVTHAIWHRPRHHKQQHYTYQRRVGDVTHIFG